MNCRYNLTKLIYFLNAKNRFVLDLANNTNAKSFGPKTSIFNSKHQIQGALEKNKETF